MLFISCAMEVFVVTLPAQLVGTSEQTVSLNTLNTSLANHEHLQNE